jgi:hypothetical protein
MSSSESCHPTPKASAESQIPEVRGIALLQLKFSETLIHLIMQMFSGLYNTKLNLLFLLFNS